MTSSVEAPRTYGGWRAQRGLGVAGLSGPETAAVALFVFALIASVGWYRAALLPMMVGLFITSILVSRVDGVAVWTRAWQLFRWYTPSARRNGTWLHPALVGDTSTSTLPGQLAHTTAWNVTVPGMDSYGVIVDEKSRSIAVTFQGNPQQLQLADPGEVDAFVANWAAFLDSLADIPQVSQVGVTVASYVDRSDRIGKLLESMKRPDSPEVSLKIMDDLANNFGAGVIRSQTQVTVTFDPPMLGRPSLEAMITDVSGYVRQIQAGLSGPGLTSLRPLTATELAAELRVQFSPKMREEIDTALGDPDQSELLQWTAAGPTRSQEQSDHYQHDGMLTRSWGLTMPPRETVTSQILYRLLRPGRFTKRVTFLWHPIPPAKAQRQLETQRFLASMWQSVRQKNSYHTTMREARDGQKADTAALEEADGSGFGNFTIIASTTFEDLENPDLVRQISRMAEQDMMESASGSRLVLRPLEKSHSAGLLAGSVAGLPVIKALRSQ